MSLLKCQFSARSAGAPGHSRRYICDMTLEPVAQIGTLLKNVWQYLPFGSPD